MGKFYVTAIRYSDDESHISHVLVHSPAGEPGRLQKGEIKTKGYVVMAMGLGSTFSTANYDYKSKKWKTGAEIGTVKKDGTIYLRTDRDATSIDNLENLLLIDELR